MKTKLILLFLSFTLCGFSASIGKWEIINKTRDSGHGKRFLINVKYTNADGSVSKTITERWYDDQVNDGDGTRANKLKKYLNMRLGLFVQETNRTIPTGNSIESVVSQGEQTIENEIVQAVLQLPRIAVGETKQARIGLKWLDQTKTFESGSGWSSSDTGVATVDSSGNITGVSIGSSVISVTSSKGVLTREIRIT